MSIGRNDLCPCGSGQKYKKCCLKAAQPTTDELFWQRMHTARNGLIEKTLKFITHTYGETAIDEAWDEFHLWDNDGSFDRDSHQITVFMPWFFYVWSPEEHADRESELKPNVPWDVSPGEAMLELKRLDDIEREYIEACVKGSFSFYEILEVWPGKGFRATDVLTGEIHDVVEKLGSRTLQAGDLTFGMAVTVRDLTTMEAMASFRIPPIQKTKVIELRRWMMGVSPNITAEIVRESSVEVLEVYHDICDEIFNPKTPVLLNTDGELIEPYRLTFEIESPSSVFDALAQLSVGNPKEELLESADKDEEGRLVAIDFPWLRLGNSKHKSWDNTVLGHIKINGNQMIVTTNSEKRAEAFEAVLSVLMPRGGWTLESKVVESDDDQSESGDENDDEINDGQALLKDPQVQAFQEKMMRAHWDEWVTSKIPILGNITPLEAVQTEDGREMLDSVLTQFERDAASRPVPGQTVELFHALRERLGL